MNDYPNLSDQQTEQPAVGQFNAEPQLGGIPPQAPPPPLYSAPPVQAPIAPAKPRRVGTFTLGLTLILLGILIPCALFFGPKVWTALQFAPVVLIFLGIETLVYVFRFQSEKLRYDGLSVFLVISITIVTLIGSAIVPPIAKAAEFTKQEYQLRQEAEEAGQRALRQLGYSGGVNSYDTRSSGRWFILWSDDEEWREPALALNFRLDGIGVAKPSKEQVTEAFYQLAKQAAEVENVTSLSIAFEGDRSEENGGWSRYDLNLYSGEVHSLTKELIERRLEVYEYAPDLGYSGDVFMDGEYSDGEQASDEADEYSGEEIID